MKKIIAASILSLMLLGVGSANSDGMRIGVGTAYADEYADGKDSDWIHLVDEEKYERTPMKECIKSGKEGLLIHQFKIANVINRYYIFDDKVYKLSMTEDTLEPVSVECNSVRFHRVPYID